MKLAGQTADLFQKILCFAKVSFFKSSFAFYFFKGCPVWSEWGEFNPCSRSCGGGETVRRRFCVNGVAGELGCVGSETHERYCNGQVCADKCIRVKMIATCVPATKRARNATEKHSVWITRASFLSIFLRLSWRLSRWVSLLSRRVIPRELVSDLELLTVTSFLSLICSFATC